MKITNAKTLSECRAVAKSAGLTFKTQNAYINNEQAYRFTDRKTGDTVMSNCTLSSAYENCCSGYIESYNARTGMFDGI